MNKFSSTHEIGMTLQTADDMSRRFKGGGDTTTTSEPPEAMQGAYKQYGNALSGTGGSEGYWTGGGQSGPVTGYNPVSGASYAGGDGSGERTWHPGTEAQGGFMENYNPEWYGGKIQADVPEYLKGAMKDYRTAIDDPNSPTGQALAYNQSVLNGDYLGLSDSMRGAVMNPAMDSMASRFAQMGRYGSPASSQQMGQAGMAATMPYYNAERDRQSDAAKRSVLFDDLRYSRNKEIGDFRMGRQQTKLDDKRAGFEFNQNKYYDKMMKYGQLLSPGTQYGIQTSQAPGGSSAAGVAGGALSGAAMGSTFGPWGALAGGVIGGIGGSM